MRGSSYLKFRNKLAQRNNYLTSFSFEMMFKLQPQMNSEGLPLTTYNAPIIDCWPHSQLNISHTGLTFWQARDDTLVLTFD